MKMDLAEGSETSVNINQTPGNHPKVDILNLESVVQLYGSLYRPDDDPDKGRNIVAKAKYIYTFKEL
jgi:hypothetical protein